MPYKDRTCKVNDCPRYSQREGLCSTHRDEHKNGPHAELPPIEDLARFGRRKPEGWGHLAACLGDVGPLERWYPETQNDRLSQAAPDVRALCHGCPVKAECIADTFHYPADENIGYRAGTFGSHREALRESLADLGMIEPRKAPEAVEVPTAYVDSVEQSAEDEYLDALDAAEEDAALAAAYAAEEARGVLV